MRNLLLAAIGAFLIFSSGAVAQTDCQWTLDGTAPPLIAMQCQGEKGAQTCATKINACLQDLDFEKSDNWFLFSVADGLERASSVTTEQIHINHQTPQHGLWLAVYVNAVAAEAIQSALDQDVAPDMVDLPYGSVIAKLNFNSRAEYAERDKMRMANKLWLTAMVKIEDFCEPTVGGTCNGGNWFYFLNRFGNFLSFEEVIGVNPDGTPIDGADVPAFGQPSAFCTDCHNPVERSDWLWTLDGALWRNDLAELPVTLPNASAGPLVPADTCAEGTITLTSDLPPDVPVDPADIPGAPARQDMFDCFSWKSFVALNWAADPEQRGQPDTSASFPALTRERVWESYKETFEVFQPSNPDWTVVPEDWNQRAAIPAVCQTVLDELEQDQLTDFSVPKLLQMATKTRDSQVLNETHQAFGNQFNILIDQFGRLVRYEVRLNRDEFQYLAENAFADTGNYSYNGPRDGTVFFPTNSTGLTRAGSIEIKASWRQLCDADTCTDTEKESFDRYYTRSALKYVPAIGERPAQCHVLPAVGLIGLHIIRKTDTSPQWIWTTFEHVDNVPAVADIGKPIPPDQPNYTLYNPQCEASPLKPTEKLCALMRPGVLPANPAKDLNPLAMVLQEAGVSDVTEETVKMMECCANLQLLANSQPAFVQDAVTNPTPSQPLLRNHVTRIDMIGADVVNARYKAAIIAAKPDNPFQYYELVSTQWPSGARDPDTGAVRKLSCAQIGTVGRDAPCYMIEPRHSSALGDSIRLRNTSMETFQVSTNGAGSAEPAHFSSAGCVNCHGNAGVDFSFVFTDAIEIDTPE